MNTAPLDTPTIAAHARLAGLLALIVLGSCRAVPSDANANAHGERTSGFVSLFDGETLDGWSGDHAFWSVEDGAIVGRTTLDRPATHNTFLRWDGGDVGDFELRVEVLMQGDNNSGIQYRSRALDGFRVVGYQCDIHPHPPYNGMLYEEGGRGIIATQGEQVRILEGGAKEPLEGATSPVPVPLEEWNEFTILARGTRLEHRLNGRVTVVVEDGDASQRAASGTIALQIHTGRPYEVRFRNVRLRRIDDAR